MGCNCGDNEYNITVNNNGNCEPTTPIYNITLANVGVNGYSPIVRFVNETVDSFNIAVDNVTGTETSPAVPKLSYVADQINNVNNTIAGLGSTYLTRDGSNAINPISINGLTIREQYGNLYINTNTLVNFSTNANPISIGGSSIDLISTGTGRIRLLSGSGVILEGAENKNIYLTTSGTGKALYNNKEIATVNQLPTVGNGTIGIMMNGDIKGSFKVNQSNNTILDLGSTSNYTAGTGIDITNNTISIDDTVVATLSDIPDITTKLNTSGSNADINFTVNGIKLSANTISSNVSTGNTSLTLNQTTSGNYINVGAGTTSTYFNTNGFSFSSDTSNQIPDITISSTGDIKIYPTLGAKLYYGGSKTAANEVATKGNLPTNFVGCDSITGGSAGLVPAPSAGDEDKFLKADGTWDTVGGGGSSYTAGTGIDITNDTISVDNTILTTNTAQTITEDKTFNNAEIQTDSAIILDGSNAKIRALVNTDSYNDIIKRSIGGILVLGNSLDRLNFQGNLTRPYYNSRELALLADVPTVGNALITFTQGGVTKGSFYTNQGINQTIELDGGGSGGGAVDSVNGQTGTVVLTASDVGALADTTIIPTVNNPTITFTQGGITKGTITLNQSSNQTIALDAGSSGSTIPPIAYGTSTTAAATVEKAVSISEITQLNVGQVIVVKPTVTSTVANSTIKLNNFTAYPMRYNNAAISTSTDSIVWNASYVSQFVFDGTYWQFLGHGLDSNTTYSSMSVSEGTTGTATTTRVLTAANLKGIITNLTSDKAAINDTTPSSSTVYSSQKTQDLINALVARIMVLEANINGGNA